jgi:hypothetical protein
VMGVGLFVASSSVLNWSYVSLSKHLQIHYMEQGCYWKANIPLSSENVPCHTLNPKAYCRQHKVTSLERVVSHVPFVDTFFPHFRTVLT